MKKLVIGVVFALGLSCLLVAQNLGQISVATEEWEDATNRDGSGLYFDILRAVYEPEGGSLSIRTVPYSRSVNLVENKRADLMIGAYVDEIEDGVYPDRHFDADRVSALYLKSRFPSFSGQNTMQGRAVAWIRGYDYDEYLDVPVGAVEVDQREQILPLLDARRVDFYLDAAYDIASVFEDGEIDESKYAVSPLMSLRLFMVFADTPRGRDLAAVWDERFAALLADGTIAELFADWEFDPYEE